MTPDTWTQDRLHVKHYPNRGAMSRAAASHIATEMQKVLAAQPVCRMIFAAAPSQKDTLEHLIATPDLDWSRVHAFHMDEYLGLDPDAPERFAAFLREALFDQVPFGQVHYLNGHADPHTEIPRYTALLAEAPIDLCVMGIGENGHIAFNDPPVADFGDPAMIKVVELDHACRTQQVNDGCFPALADVPTHALTLTIPALMAAHTLVCIVPGSTKAQAVYATLNGPITTDCPASILRTHQDATLYIDALSGAKL